MSVHYSLLYEKNTDLCQIKDAVGNEYGRPKDVAGEQRMAFTSHADAAFDVCFENILSGGEVNDWSLRGYILTLL